MRDINVIGYSMVFVLPWLAVLAGVVILLVPTRRTAAHAESPRRAA